MFNGATFSYPPFFISHFTLSYLIFVKFRLSRFQLQASPYTQKLTGNSTVSIFSFVTFFTKVTDELFLSCQIASIS